ncbi:zygote arrest protein 1 [Artibeus jamaicensis]|uniref:zygote arrest protein 1 n=1 Tax=Artibeus jamaicensis TaxID=9417 RepID=UPI00235B1410|nr:zygote arrest protein 1 [Artibeus jamaicensis]
MASLGDEVQDGYMYPACAAYSYPYPYPPAAKGKGLAGGVGWRPRGGGYPAAASSSSSSAGAAPPSFPGYGQLMAADYFDNFQRAQLMALLSQVSPGLAPRPRKVGSRDAAVQVNPRRDASVQCSLGRRTLLRRPRDAGPPASPGPEGAAGCASSPQPAGGAREHDSPPSGGPRPVHFPRTVALYSPLVSRRLTTFLDGAEAPAREQRPGAPDAERGPPPAKPRDAQPGEGSARSEPQAPQSQEEEEAGAAARASWEPRETRAAEAAPRNAPRSPEQPPPARGAQAAEGARSSPRSPEPGKERLRFQFLEQKYGYYHCKDCNIRWESAYVWCVQGTSKVYFKQFCRTCQKSYNPYRVEDITCQSCKQTRCSCSVKLRHIDPKRPHRQDLCGRCKGKRLSCDSSFSFKYII